MVPAIAAATTGPGLVLRYPRYGVARHLWPRYLGKFALTHTSDPRHVHTSTVLVYAASGGRYLVGLLHVYGEDEKGRNSSWIGTLYDFHALAPNRMQMNVLDDDGSKFGRLTVRHGPGGTLSGRLQVDGEGTYRVAYRKTRHGPRVSAGRAPGASSRAQAGWTGARTGRYVLTATSQVSNASQSVSAVSDGVLSDLVRRAMGVVQQSRSPIGGAAVTAGSLVLSGRGAAQSAALRLSGGTQQARLFLTDLQTSGTQERTATARSGSPAGAARGTFTVTRITSKRIAGILRLGAAERRVTFARR